MDKDNATGDPTIVKGKLSILSQEVLVLIDPGSTHSYLTPTFTSKINQIGQETPFYLSISTLLGKEVEFDRIYQDCEIWIRGVNMP